jgi:hypothetical protein
LTNRVWHRWHVMEFGRSHGICKVHTAFIASSGKPRTIAIRATAVTQLSVEPDISKATLEWRTLSELQAYGAHAVGGSCISVDPICTGSSKNGYWSVCAWTACLPHDRWQLLLRGLCNTKEACNHGCVLADTQLDVRLWHGRSRWALGRCFRQSCVAFQCQQHHALDTSSESANKLIKAQSYEPWIPALGKRTTQWTTAMRPQSLHDAPCSLKKQHWEQQGR